MLTGAALRRKRVYVNAVSLSPATHRCTTASSAYIQDDAPSMNDKLKLILHMGPPKTGTTSLQAGLHELRPRLADAGILYPVSPIEVEPAHHILTALYGEWSSIKHSVQRHFDSLEAAHRHALEFVESVKQSALDSGFHTIVLSSETIFPTEGRETCKLLPVLRKITPDIQPVVYIREPASHYKSRLQQAAKAGEFRLPYPLWSNRSALEELEQALEKSPIVRAYDREQLRGGDIVRDFCEAVLELDLASNEIPKLNENVSMSAEATFLLIAMGEHVRQLADDGDGSALGARNRAIIRKFVDTENRLTKLELKPELTARIRSSAVEYIWLRERYGIEFKQLDYDNISDEPESFSGYNSPLDLFEIDRNALAWLSAAVIHEIGRRKSFSPKKNENANANNVSPKRKKFDISALFGRN